MRQYIKSIDTGFYDKISLHSHHDLVDELGLGGKHFKSDQEVNAVKEMASKSFHSLQDIKQETAELSYSFLSPVFDSLSKPNYYSTFDHTALKSFVKTFTQYPLYALGGITTSNVNKAKDMGFAGVALLGAIWQEANSIKRLDIAKKVMDV